MTSRLGFFVRLAMAGWVLAVAVSAEARAEARRFAVVVGSNIGDQQEARLRFAEADAEKIAHTLRSVGEFPAAQVLQLTGVNADEVRRALIELNARLRQESSDTVLFVYYSGHADADRLHLGGSYLGVRELRDILAGSSAGSRVLVIDACRSGSMTRVKGGKPIPAFTVHLDEMPPPAGLAILTSSAEGEDSQESDVLAGSFFTHYLNSGLIGAADQNHDGQVTLAEAFSFASEQTFRATLATTAGPQHPTFRFELGGRQDLILARPRSPRQGLGIVQFTSAGNYVLRRADASGQQPVVAEVAARTGGAQVALPEGRYTITLRNPDHVLEGSCEIRDGAVSSVSASELRRVDNARLVRKGGALGRVYSLVVAGGVSVSQVAGSACLNRLDALDSSRAFVVSDWLPGARFAPDSLPAVQCPVVDPVNDARGVAALSPDGHTLLLNAPPNLVFRDLDTGTDKTIKATVGLPDALAWIGDRIVAVTSSYALDYFTAWATILDVANPQGAPTTVSGLRPHTFWLGTSGGRLVGFESGSGSTNNPTLWLVDPQANTAVSKDIVLPSKFATMAQLWNDKFVAFSDTEAIVFNLDGVEQMRLSFPPSIAAAKSRFLSNLGWFATSNAGELLRFDPALGIVEVVVANCIQCQLLGADNQRVYVQAFGPEALGPLLPPPDAPLGDLGNTPIPATRSSGRTRPRVAATRSWGATHSQIPTYRHC